ncbi:hypothetical protein IEQ34_003055 [Dendrobium chrysotoxum]|uniref:K+ potassium transporter integral membrane domain-containing protein n=1 Tax=Dendrobium chrysotoxum TaxID=161865 RepID=A0AAV7HI77_DENCH|nr:hypothetical protein IEQ34_003055 [Dendrobium chrysotoxum]
MGKLNEEVPLPLEWVAIQSSMTLDAWMLLDAQGGNDLMAALIARQRSLVDASKVHIYRDALSILGSIFSGCWHTQVLNIETVGSEPMEKNGEPVEEVHEEEKQKKKPFHSLDSLDKEANKISSLHSASKVVSMATVLQLAFQSIGVVYGDIGTSPLYVFPSTFLNRVPSKNDVVGALSLIIYTLTLFPLIKYVFIVLWANDNGDGGTFALYSLICRNSKVSAIPNERQEEMELSAYKLKIPNKNLKRAQRIKEALESSCWAKTSLLSMALLGTCMVIGDGILTPCISVLSAVDGVRKFDTGMSKDIVAMISIFILVILFSIQRFGTDKVSYTFALSILLWFMLIGSIGIFNIFRHDSTVLKAFNPIYIISYFKRDPKAAWISLGGVVLCMTGTEAMFADLGHFSVRSIQIAFSGLVYPCLIFPESITDAFYNSIPGRRRAYIYTLIPLIQP